VAGVLDFAGVGVVFNHQVLQGNRSVPFPFLFSFRFILCSFPSCLLRSCYFVPTLVPIADTFSATKISPNLYSAFASPCHAPLISLNVNISKSTPVHRQWSILQIKSSACPTSLSLFTSPIHPTIRFGPLHILLYPISALLHPRRSTNPQQTPFL
jgi:hypothetical protein